MTITTYKSVFIKNSMSARRKGLCAKKDHWSKLTFKDPAGEPLQRSICSRILRSIRSKYTRHIGKKQLAKMAAKKVIA